MKALKRKHAGEAGGTTRSSRNKKPRRRALSEKQRQVLDIIKETMRRTGKAPTHTQLRQALGLSGKGAVGTHLRALERKGFIEERDRWEVGCRLTQPDAVPLLKGTGRIAAREPLISDTRMLGQVAGTIADRFTPRPDCFITAGKQATTACGIEACDLIGVRTNTEAESGFAVVTRVDGKLCVERFLGSDAAQDKPTGHIDAVVVGALCARAVAAARGQRRQDKSEPGRDCTDPLDSAEMRGWNKGALTQLQAEVLELIRQELKRTGRAPSQDELMIALGHKTAGSTGWSLRALERKNWITRTPRKHRTIRIVNSREVPLIKVKAAIASEEAVLARTRIADRIAPAIADLFTPRPHYLLELEDERASGPGAEHADLVAVRATSDAEEDDIVVAREGTQVTIARVGKTETGETHLTALGANREVAQGTGRIRIEGVVVGTLTTRFIESPDPGTNA